MLHELRVHHDLVILCASRILSQSLFESLGFIRAVPSLLALAGLLASMIIVVVSHGISVCRINTEEPIVWWGREHEASFTISAVEYTVVVGVDDR